MSELDKNDIERAMNAWSYSHISDDDLDLVIKALHITINTIYACGGNWISTAGLIGRLHSMESAQNARKRDAAERAKVKS